MISFAKEPHPHPFHLPLTHLCTRPPYNPTAALLCRTEPMKNLEERERLRPLAEAVGGGFYYKDCP